MLNRAENCELFALERKILWSEAEAKRANEPWEKFNCDVWTQEEVEEILRYEQIRGRGQ